MKSSYNPVVGYLKALGIVLMVFGHSESGIPHAMGFIQMFHMPLFFIASGYCFKQKYLDAHRQYIYNKAKGIWWPYVKWGLLFLMLHNLFFYLNLYNNQYGYRGDVSHLYNLHGICYTAFAIVTRMQGAEQLLGGYWFLNALFFGSIIAWLVIRYVRNVLFGGAILFCICTILNKTCWHLPFFGISAQAFAAALLILIGYAMAKYRVKLFKVWQIAIGLAFTLLGSFLWNMPMNQDSYSNRRFGLYILSASIATWCFYSLFERMEESRGMIVQAMEFIGKHTLTILTWHFLAFKLVSLFIIWQYRLPIERLAEFPVILEYSNQGWWVAYFLVAMLVTCGVACCNRWIRNPWLKL